KCPSAPVDWCRENLKQGSARAVVVNSGNANAFTGLKGRDSVKLTAEIAAKAEKLSQDLTSMAEKGLRFDAETAEAIGRSEARHGRSGRIALWVIAATLVYIAWTLG
ncbi:MAG: bifunctional ornithine acetyltransferase/N-acetylglutamate synthase, partial [Shinella sp.]|nr:bifunctional ornithine acetyltransferase/N-acetylglutamate synthase [Shinella sp.]